MKIRTPVVDFINEYENSGITRFHMPGHKGRVLHGLENMDITEISGADYLFEAEGIIAQSESITSQLFGAARTLYSTEGSSLSIKTMLGIIKTCRKNASEKMLIVAPRNVHKAFINGCCLLDAEVRWVYPSSLSSQICSSSISADDVKRTIENCHRKPDAVYITSPDYLGNIADIKGIAYVCRSFGVPLLVDNAHGAYLRFLEKSMHPIDLGADICVDSAHKTLPVYTGGGYLHISKNAPSEWCDSAKEVMALFASTSPSYLIMGSLDKCCGELQGDLPHRIRDSVKKVATVAQKLNAIGWKTMNAEPLKLTIYSESNGYSGSELSDMLRAAKIECEYSDSSCVVLMCSPYNDDEDYERLINTLESIPKSESILTKEPDKIPHAVVKMSIREAYFSHNERIRVEDAEGRICARSAVSCQPSIPVVVPGEVITADIIKILKRYSIFYVNVI